VALGDQVESKALAIVLSSSTSESGSLRRQQRELHVKVLPRPVFALGEDPAAVALVTDRR